jgi:hypothetical protein
LLSVTNFPSATCYHRQILRTSLKVAISILAVLLGFAVQSEASSPTPVDILSCKIGVYLSDLRDLDAAAKTFNARLWFWSLCPENDQEPLKKQLSFSNGDRIETGSFSQKLSKDQQWGLIRAEGVFRHLWDVHNFPFDRQTLEVAVTASDDLDHFRFLVDENNSSFNPDIHVPGWRITGFRLLTGERQYTTTFGDPLLPNGKGSTYSRIRVLIDVERSDRTLFLRHTGALYTAFLFAMFTFLMISPNVSTMEVRVGMLGASLFATVLSMQAANAATRSEGLTLIDELHLLTLAYILFGAIVTLISWRWIHKNFPITRVVSLNKQTFWCGTATYAMATAALVSFALWLR